MGRTIIKAIRPYQADFMEMVLFMFGGYIFFIPAIDFSAKLMSIFAPFVSHDTRKRVKLVIANKFRVQNLEILCMCNP